jgi:hypothetical protein
MERAADGMHDIRTEKVKGGGECGDDAEGDCEERFSCEHARSLVGKG